MKKTIVWTLSIILAIGFIVGGIFWLDSANTEAADHPYSISNKDDKEVNFGDDFVGVVKDTNDDDSSIKGGTPTSNEDKKVVTKPQKEEKTDPIKGVVDILDNSTSVENDGKDVVDTNKATTTVKKAETNNDVTPPPSTAKTEPTTVKKDNLTVNYGDGSATDVEDDDTTREIIDIDSVTTESPDDVKSMLDEYANMF